MVALRSSLLGILVLSSCVHSAQIEIIDIDNKVNGCFTFVSWRVDSTLEPLILRAVVGQKTSLDCPCKSALFRYVTSQRNDSDVSNLMSGSFTTLGKSEVGLAIASQKQLILPELPIKLSLSCSSN